jgi:hypothetical protein
LMGMLISERYVFGRRFRSISQVWLIPGDFVTIRAFHKKLRKTRLRSYSSAALALLMSSRSSRATNFSTYCRSKYCTNFPYITQFVVCSQLPLNSNKFIFSTLSLSCFKLTNIKICSWKRTSIL